MSGARPDWMAPGRFYGDRDGGVTDMAGNIWWIATHVEDLSDEEISGRAAKEEARQ